MSTHAKLSASGSHRWANCAGSVAAEAKVKRSFSSPAAEEGTCAHELAELVLLGGGNAYDWEGRNLVENSAFVVSREMCGYVQQYVDYVRAQGGRQEYEQRVHFNDWIPDGFGTADALVLDGSTLRVIDLKYGKGVKVFAEENTQGILYALGALSEYETIADIETVVVSIVQPRLDHIDEWELSKGELLRWGEWLSQRAEEALSLDAPRTAGDEQCKFCAAKATCPALQKLTHDVIMTDFDNIDDTANPDTLTMAQLNKALSAKKLIVSWLDAVESHVFELLEKGEHNDQFKLVEGRSLRKWGDAEAASKTLVELLGDNAYERSLLSVAKAEKALGKAKASQIADLVVKPRGKPTIVPISDKRPAIGATLNDFENIS
jgi:hypothetical protein